MWSADCFSCFLASSLSPNALMNFSFGFSSFVSVKEFCYYHCFLDIYNVHIIHVQCTYYTYPMYVLCISNVNMIHTWNHLRVSLFEHLDGSPLSILYGNLASPQRSVHLDHIPEGYFNAQCNDLIITMNVATIMIIMMVTMIMIMMMTMMILCCLSLCIGLSPRQVRDEPEFCCYYHLRKDNPVTINWTIEFYIETVALE